MTISRDDVRSASSRAVFRPRLYPPDGSLTDGSLKISKSQLLANSVTGHVLLCRSASPVNRPGGFCPPLLARDPRRTPLGARLKTYTPRAITGQCAYTITHPDQRTLTGSSI